MMDVCYSLIETVWGEFLVGWNERGIVSLKFPRHFPQVSVSSPRGPALRLAQELREYLAGGRRDFTVPFVLTGTEFQRLVWEALLEIPYGKTVTYGELARWIGRPRAARAVGGAVGANPIPIVVPCHRVVPKTGGIGNYGPGPHWKRKLLRLEGALR
jgi:O-6-methylguanine DNA methyltransferase